MISFEVIKNLFGLAKNGTLKEHYEWMKEDVDLLGSLLQLYTPQGQGAMLYKATAKGFKGCTCNLWGATYMYQKVTCGYQKATCGYQKDYGTRIRSG